MSELGYVMLGLSMVAVGAVIGAATAYWKQGRCGGLVARGLCRRSFYHRGDCR